MVLIAYLIESIVYTGWALALAVGFGVQLWRTRARQLKPFAPTKWLTHRLSACACVMLAVASVDGQNAHGLYDNWVTALLFNPCIGLLCCNYAVWLYFVLRQLYGSVRTAAATAAGDAGARTSGSGSGNGHHRNGSGVGHSGSAGSGSGTSGGDVVPRLSRIALGVSVALCLIANTIVPLIYVGVDRQFWSVCQYGATALGLWILTGLSISGYTSLHTLVSGIVSAAQTRQHMAALALHLKPHVPHRSAPTAAPTTAAAAAATTHRSTHRPGVGGVGGGVVTHGGAVTHSTADATSVVAAGGSVATGTASGAVMLEGGAATARAGGCVDESVLAPDLVPAAQAGAMVVGSFADVSHRTMRIPIPTSLAAAGTGVSPPAALATPLLPLTITSPSIGGGVSSGVSGGISGGSGSVVIELAKSASPVGPAPQADTVLAVRPVWGRAKSAPGAVATAAAAPASADRTAESGAVERTFGMAAAAPTPIAATTAGSKELDTTGINAGLKVLRVVAFSAAFAVCWITGIWVLAAYILAARYDEPMRAPGTRTSYDPVPAIGGLPLWVGFTLSLWHTWLSRAVCDALPLAPSAAAPAASAAATAAASNRKRTGGGSGAAGAAGVGPAMALAAATGAVGEALLEHTQAAAAAAAAAAVVKPSAAAAALSGGADTDRAVKRALAAAARAAAAAAAASDDGGQAAGSSGDNDDHTNTSESPRQHMYTVHVRRPPAFAVPIGGGGEHSPAVAAGGAMPQLSSPTHSPWSAGGGASSSPALDALVMTAPSTAPVSPAPALYAVRAAVYAAAAVSSASSASASPAFAPAAGSSAVTSVSGEVDGDASVAADAGSGSDAASGGTGTPRHTGFAIQINGEVSIRGRVAVPDSPPTTAAPATAAAVAGAVASSPSPPAAPVLRPTQPVPMPSAPVAMTVSAAAIASPASAAPARSSTSSSQVRSPGLGRHPHQRRPRLRANPGPRSPPPTVPVAATVIGIVGVSGHHHHPRRSSESDGLGFYSPTTQHSS